MGTPSFSSGAVSDPPLPGGWLEGTTATGASTRVSVVPNGVYTVKLTVTKALGTAAETETWTSPSITVARP